MQMGFEMMPINNNTVKNFLPVNSTKGDKKQNQVKGCVHGAAFICFGQAS